MTAAAALGAAAIVSAILALAIKKYHPELAVVLSICACAAILLWAVTNAAQVFGGIGAIAESAGINDEYLAIVFKAAGICFITEFACDCCKDAGQNALAGNTVLAGKILVIITVMPLFEEILSISMELTGI